MLYILKRKLLILVFISSGVFAGTPVINIWAGSVFTMPNSGSWHLTAGNGRIIAGGNGIVSFVFPEVREGCFLETTLKCSRKTLKIVGHSPKLLSGSAFICRDPYIKKQLELMGAVVYEEKTFPENIPEIINHPEDRSESPLILCFPNIEIFPFTRRIVCEKMTLHNFPGTDGFKVSVNENEFVFDLNGSTFCAIFSNGRKKIVLFSCRFNFNSVEWGLRLKNVLMECKR